MQRPDRGRAHNLPEIFRVHQERRGRREVLWRVSLIAINTTKGIPPTDVKRSNTLRPTHGHTEEPTLCTPTGWPLQPPPTSQRRGGGDTNVHACVQDPKCPSSIRDHEVRRTEASVYLCVHATSHCDYYIHVTMAGWGRNLNHLEPKFSKTLRLLCTP